ncbi:MAG: anti-sigma factor [Pseudomonadota bacterium]
MKDRDFDDETLMAFADGELDHDTSQAIEKAMQFNEALALRVKGFAETRSLAQKSFKPLLDEPVPDDLLSNVEAMLEQADTLSDSEESSDEGASVVAFKLAPPAKKATPSSQWFMPIAASIAIVAAGVAGFAIGTSTQAPGTGELQIAEFNQPGLVDALKTIASGEETALSETGDRFRLIASFRDVDNDLCREFEVDQKDRSTFVSVACLEDGIWKLHFTVAAASQSEDGFAPASSLDSLDAYLDAIGAGEPMSIRDEAEALKQIR